MGTKEGFALVAFGWMAAAMVGALPYVLLGVGMVDGLFESMSGFTTTGASILTEYSSDGYWILNATAANHSVASNLAGGFQQMTMNLSLNLSFNATLDNSTNGTLLNSTLLNGSLWDGGLFAREAGNATDALNATAQNVTAQNVTAAHTYRGLLFWRAFSQWLGGMGIILLFIAILPKLGVAGRQLYKAEVPGPEKDALTPRIRQTAKLLWGVYLALTVLEVILLALAGMPIYDAVCNTFATMATGGFSPQSASILAYNSPLMEGIIVLFMFLAGANFALHYRTIHQDRTCLFRDPEFRLYAAIVLVATAVIMAWGGLSGEVAERFRFSIFQVVSMMTTTGFATDDFDRWSAAGKLVLFMLMFIGACAGSTGGAIKVSRLLLVLKYAYRELFTALHPKVVMPVKLGANPVKEEILRASVTFFGLYLIIFAAASLILAAISYHQGDMNMEAILSAVATTLGNVGPGFGPVGPVMSFAEVHPLGKILLVFCMWIGRLEIITALVLILPEFWKR
ncbi:MAG: TrkH family potassium uptake protein [Methanosarcinales archaeon]|nr:TrkH family potassium uptake protein [Methanosarcinales archaeon]